MRVEEYKERCRHCVYLGEDSNGNWTCDSVKKCKDIIECNVTKKREEV